MTRYELGLGDGPFRRIAITALVAVPALAFALGSPALAQGVDICHIPPDNPDNVRVISVGGRAAASHLEEHGDLPVVGFNINGVGCAFCADIASEECQVFCVGPPLCQCPPDDGECCEQNPCCESCPEPKPEQCSVITCGSEPPECSLTVCSAR